jgi:serine/threonine protein kinase/outer membrane protein assembly factor BamB
VSKGKIPSHEKSGIAHILLIFTFRSTSVILPDELSQRRSLEMPHGIFFFQESQPRQFIELKGMKRMTDLTGQQFGSYRLVRCLGVGGFASVYLGQHVRLSSKQAAIKILNLRNVDVEQFRQEAETTERLVHPNIVRLLDFDIQGETPFLVLDYAPGGSLRVRHPKGRQVPIPTVTRYLKEIVPALQHAHDQRILHRDIKPDNILIGRQGELLLSDFGIALLSRTGTTSEQDSTSTNIGGTPTYMAPEQFLGKPEPASDQYALATVVYEWLSGSAPFQGNFIQLGYQHTHELVPPLRKSAPLLPAAVEQVLMVALAKHPSARFPSVQAFAQALDAACQQRTTSLQYPVLLESHKDVLNRPADGSAQAKERISLSAVPIVPSKADQRVSMETPATLMLSSRTTGSVEGSAPLAVPVSHQAQKRRKRVLVILTFLLLLALGGGGSLSYFWFFAPPSASHVMFGPPSVSQAMFGFDAAHTHNNPYEHTLGPANVSRLTALWTFTAGGGISSSPAVAGGMVYVGSLDNRLYAFDASCRKDCQPLWSFATGSSISSSPAVAGGMVYVGSDDNKFYVFDASCRKDCQPLWLWAFESGSGTHSSPVVAGGMVYVGSDDNKLHAFDAGCRKGCQPLWNFETGGSIHSSPAVAGGVVYVSSLDGRLYAFDASCRSACQPLWSFETGASIASSPAVAGGMVYVGSGTRKLYAFDATCRKGCQPLWSFATGSEITSSPAIADGMVYIGSGDGKVYAFDARCRNACQPLWSFATGDAISSSPAVAGGVVYIGSSDGKVYAFDASCRNACQPLWNFTTGGKISSSPAVVGGMVYVGSTDNKLYAFGLAA